MKKILTAIAVQWAILITLDTVERAYHIWRKKNV